MIAINTIAKALSIRPVRLRAKVHRMNLRLVEKTEDCYLSTLDVHTLCDSYLASPRTSQRTQEVVRRVKEALLEGRTDSLILQGQSKDANTIVKQENSYTNKLIPKSRRKLSAYKLV